MNRVYIESILSIIDVGLHYMIVTIGCNKVICIKDVAHLVRKDNSLRMWVHGKAHIFNAVRKLAVAK